MRAVLALGCGLTIALSGCATVDEQPSDRLGHAALQTAAGAPAGSVRLLASGAEVNISVTGAGLPPGAHGLHLHTTGACSGTAFDAAGGHLNPDSREHGADNPAGAHLGDLPNLIIGSDGSGSASATLRGARAEVLAALFDADGSAVVIHAAPDDYRSQPAGSSGARIACGVLIAG